MIKPISFLLLLFVTAASTGAQLQIKEQQKEPTNMLLVQTTEASSANETLRIKRSIQKLLGIKLKSDNTLNYNNLKKFIADRAINLREQDLIIQHINETFKGKVIFVSQSNMLDSSPDVSIKSNRKSKPTKVLK